MSVFEQYALAGDTSAAGDNLYLICPRCINPDDAVLPVIVRRFSTNYGEDVVTLQNVWDAAREHDGMYHDGFRPQPVADTGSVNIIRGTE